MLKLSVLNHPILIALLLACGGTTPSGSSGVKRATSTGTQGTGAVGVTQTKTTDNGDGTTTDGNATDGDTTGTTGTNGGTATNTGTNLTANVTCPATTDFACNCQTADNGAVACEPSIDRLGDWEHSGTVGTKTAVNNTATLVDCPQVAEMAATTFRITCCYTVCGEYAKTVTAASCTKIDAKSFACK